MAKLNRPLSVFISTAALVKLTYRAELDAGVARGVALDVKLEGELRSRAVVARVEGLKGGPAPSAVGRDGNVG